MGTTYSNCQVRTDSQEAVVAALTGLLKEPAYVAPAVNGWVGVYPEGGATDPDKLAKNLSAKLSCGAFTWMVHDSDVFYYTLYENGKPRDTFNSNPDFGTNSDDEDALPPDVPERKRMRGKPKVLLPLCAPGTTLAAIQSVLHPQSASEAAKKLILFSPTSGDQYLFADHQASELAKLLGMDQELSQIAYSDISQEDTEDYTLEDFRLLGNENLSQEYKNAKLLTSFRLEDLEAAVKMGADVNARDGQGVPLLVKVARYCASEQMQFLISKGADVNAASLFNNPDDPLHAWLVQEELGDALEDEITALVVAAGASSEHPTRQREAVQILLDAKADVNARSETGRTALSEALQMTDWTKHRKKIRRRAPEDVLRAAAAQSALVVEMLWVAGAVE